MFRIHPSGGCSVVGLTNKGLKQKLLETQMSLDQVYWENMEENPDEFGHHDRIFLVGV